MDLANLNAFIAIAETGSFSGAGERLHLTQPAISKRIAGLEQQLNVRLFDRLGREAGRRRDEGLSPAEECHEY